MGVLLLLVPSIILSLSACSSSRPRTRRSSRQKRASSASRSSSFPRRRCARAAGALLAVQPQYAEEAARVINFHPCMTEKIATQYCNLHRHPDHRLLSPRGQLFARIPRAVITFVPFFELRVAADVAVAIMRRHAQRWRVTGKLRLEPLLDRTTIDEPLRHNVHARVAAVRQRVDDGLGRGERARFGRGSSSRLAAHAGARIVLRCMFVRRGFGSVGSAFIDVFAPKALVLSSAS